MASLRRQCLVQLRTLLRTLPGWSVEFAGKAHDSQAAVRAEIFWTSEDKQLANDSAYETDLFVVVLIVINNADANSDPLPEGDEDVPDLYLERMIREAEAILHDDEQWGGNPAFTDVWATGHDIIDPGEDGLRQSQTHAAWRLQFHLQHDVRDPDQ